MPDARVAIHMALSLGMLWLSAILALPGDTFGSAKGWGLFARLAPETCWAVVFWTVGCIGLLGLATDRAGVRLLSVLLLATGYGVVAGFMLIANPAGSGSGTYAIFGAGLGYYLAFRRTHEGV